MTDTQPPAVSPKAITDVERRFMGHDPDQLYDELLAVTSAHRAARIVRHLQELDRNPRRAIDSCSGKARWEWRKVLLELEGSTPPPSRRRARRSQAGVAQLGTLAAVASGGTAVALGRPLLGAALVITSSGGDEVEELLAA